MEEEISFFWKLPYCPVLSVRHCLDPMHITKNVCGNTLNTLMDTGGTSKDSLATCLDMQHLGIRKELHPVELENGQFKLPVASWTLKKEEKRVHATCHGCRIGLKLFLRLAHATGEGNTKFRIF